MNLKYSIIFSYGKRSLTTAFLPSYPNCLRSVTAKYANAMPTSPEGGYTQRLLPHREAIEGKKRRKRA
ncbi:hypothetical protein AFLA_002239 [Aspergillus flavus NRRL3357]|nr:hypothetical protein AFLA_002239 [Aspergillus flavus NRRL3357]